VILWLQRHHVDILKQEAKKVDPVEACGMLFGRLSRKEAFVEKVVLAPNELQSALRFEIDPEKVATSFIEAEQQGLDFIGLFHSHSAPAALSPIDLEYMKLWGDALWLILSSINGNLEAYQLCDGTVKEVNISIQ
jgi:proteasome lid subunit RPN8/RPN11